MCKERNMNLASFEKALESDMVTDFIGALGIIFLHIFVFCIIVSLLSGMDSSTIFTSLAKDDSGAFDWLGGVSSKFLNWGQGQPKADAGNCGGTTKGFLQVLPCETPNNFLCESIDPL